MEAAEATYGLLEQWSSPSKRRGTIRLFTGEAGYLQAGGIHGSAGVHYSARNEVLMRLDPDQLTEVNRRVLMHEVTHQALHDLLKSAPPWLGEGIAIYVESIPFRAGRFLEGHVHFRRAPLLRGCPGNRIKTTPMASLLRSERSDWNAQFQINSHGVNQQYKTAYLMTYYLVHFQAAPSPRPFRQFLTAIHETLTASRSSELAFRTGAHALSTSECQALETLLIEAYAEVDLQIEPQPSESNIQSL